jgi:hypothetical protein
MFNRIFKIKPISKGVLIKSILKLRNRTKKGSFSMNFVWQKSIWPLKNHYLYLLFQNFRVETKEAPPHSKGISY